jgi:hypothetical protein
MTAPGATHSIGGEDVLKTSYAGSRIICYPLLEIRNSKGRFYE